MVYPFEARMPFLDYRSVQYVLELPGEFKVAHDLRETIVFGAILFSVLICRPIGFGAQMKASQVAA